MSTQHDDDMPDEIDLSGGTRGKVHRPGLAVKLPAEPEAQAPPAVAPTDDPAFGIWRDPQDMADVAAYIRRIRAPRFTRDGSRRKT